MLDQSAIYGLGAGCVLGGLVVATLYFQNRTFDRAKEVIEGLSPAVRATNLAQAVLSQVNRKHQDYPLFKLGFALPTYILTLLVALGSFVTFAKVDFTSSLFGGPIFDHSNASGPTFQPLVVAVAFIVCYVWMMWQFVIKVNMHDLTPKVYYCFAVRMLTVFLVAGLIQFLAMLGLNVNATAAQGFVTAEAFTLGAAVLVGRNPRLWLDHVTDFIWSKIPNGVSKRLKHPEPEDMPGLVPLTMIGGMTDDKIDRLSELGIDNVDQLGSENPVSTWVLTRYNLALVMHWAAQAQLARRVTTSQLKKLELMGINDIFDYKVSLESPEALAVLAQLLDIDLDVLATHRTALAANADYVNLLELRDAVCIASRTLEAANDDQDAGHVVPLGGAAIDNSEGGLCSVCGANPGEEVRRGSVSQAGLA